jgi:hypothetical protein
MAVDLVYNIARQNFAVAQWNWNLLPVNLMLVAASYTPAATDQFVSDIPAAAILARDVALTNLTVSPTGIVRGIIPQLTALDLETPVAALLLYSKGVSDAVSPLIYYSSSGVGFPFTAAGGNYVLAYDQGNGGFFQV